MQFLLFGRLFKWFGMRALLAAVPLIMVAGYALFALAPFFMVLIVVYARAARRRLRHHAARAATRCLRW